ncbi:restriction endonuclease subunit S [Janthinobacterium sp. HSC-3S05]|uniref:restriction endonuclease subunit S n=1 Tax=Janthinobacterium lividum TaxID=29581 RepID=UPI001CD82082|nr:restriction endonuclease subunit S [Janthinobacterium lividum]MCA1862462.1 restriction endonuclease subunit S [Janthinobacterium lividum]
MSSEWTNSTLGEFVRFQRGHDLTADEQKSGVIPVMGSAGQNGTHNESKANGPGLVVGRSGASIGRVHWSPVDFWPHNTCLYVTDFLGNSPRFVFYLLQTLNLATYNSGSAQPSLNRNYIYSIKVCVPIRAEQDAIAELLEAFDDRIALLRETNTTLEAIAQALFKSWFVDFDPVRAKLEGRVPEGMDEATAVLFPDSFEESALGLSPRGWRVGRVDDLVELAYGKALKASDRTAGSVPVYGSGGVTGYHNQAFVCEPSVIVGRKGTVGSLYWEDRPFFPIDTVFYVKTSKPLTYCFYQLARLGLKDMNTDGAVPGLNRNNVYRLMIVLPPDEILAKFDAVASILREKIFSNIEQIDSLSTLRDTMLPRLISGQLRLPEAETILEEAIA